MDSVSRDGFFRPADGWVGDVIPVTDGESARLFYLFDSRAQPDTGMPWRVVTTGDFVTFEDEGTALPAGGPDDPDLHCYTGSVLVHEGTAHLFYTGHNPKRTAADGVTELQVVLHATSDDGMRSWTKHPDHGFGAPEGFDPADWRDPFVFRESADVPWRMLLAARRDRGPERRRGVVVQLRSDDLVSWRLDEPLWDPRRYITQECPDVFEWNGVWYLVYSEFSDAFQTRYRIADSPDGPWRAPEHDTVDGRAFYAAKSLELGGRRFFVGWIATKAGGTDDGAWQWAGTMATLEAVQRPDGELAFRIPQALLDRFDDRIPVSIPPSTLDATDRHLSAVADQAAPSAFRLTVEADVEAGTHAFGVLLRASADGDEAYQLRLEPLRNRLVLDRWPRRRTGTGQWQVSGDVPYAVELERPVPLPPGRHRVEVVVDGDLLVATVDDRVSLSARLYDRQAGHVGTFVTDGTVHLHRFELSARSRRPAH